MWGSKLIPFLQGIIPYAARNFVREFHESRHPILLCNTAQVLADLLGRRVEIGPMRVRIEGVLVAMSWDIARTALHMLLVGLLQRERSSTWISVFPPRPTYTIILLVYLKVNIPQSLWYSNAQIDPRVASPNDPDLQRPQILNRFVLDGEGRSNRAHDACCVSRSVF